MLSRRIAHVALNAVTALSPLFLSSLLGLGLSGCGNPPSIVGSWGSTVTAGPSLQMDWSFKFAADNTFTLTLVTSSTATSGRGAGCVNTVTASGVYTAAEPTLTVTAQSGGSIYERCLNSAENTTLMPFNAANLAMLSTDFSGPFSVTADQLTLKTPASGIGPGALIRQ